MLPKVCRDDQNGRKKMFYTNASTEDVTKSLR